MHPVKGILLEEDAFSFVRDLRRQLLFAEGNARAALGREQGSEAA